MHACKRQCLIDMLLCALQKHVQNDSKPALNLVILLLASVGIRLFTTAFFFDCKKKKTKTNPNPKTTTPPPCVGSFPLSVKSITRLPATPEGVGSGLVEVGLQQVQNNAVNMIYCVRSCACSFSFSKARSFAFILTFGR